MRYSLSIKHIAKTSRLAAPCGKFVNRAMNLTNDWFACGGVETVFQFPLHDGSNVRNFDENALTVRQQSGGFDFQSVMALLIRIAD